jgi:hypothetical protein
MTDHVNVLLGGARALVVRDAATRGIFHSYGSCDTDRPISDAQLLGLL